MGTNFFFGLFFVPLCAGLVVLDQDKILEKSTLSAADVASLLDQNGLVPDGSKPMEYASFLLNGDKWSNYVVKEEGQFKHIPAQALRENLEEILGGANLNKTHKLPPTKACFFGICERTIPTTMETTMMTATETTGCFSGICQTTIPTTMETTMMTTTETTTENPANFPKTGEIELLVPHIVHSGHMMHWSPTQEVLYIADIWGQKYIRFEELAPPTTTIPPPTTTIPPPTTTVVAEESTWEESTSSIEEAVTTAPATVVDPQADAKSQDSARGWARQLAAEGRQTAVTPSIAMETDTLVPKAANPTTQQATLIFPETTIIPPYHHRTIPPYYHHHSIPPFEATEIPSLYDIRAITFPKDVAFYGFEDATDPEHAFIVSTLDLDNAYGGKAFVGLNRFFLLVQFDTETEEGAHRVYGIDDYHRLNKIWTLSRKNEVGTAAWTDPRGRLHSGTYDARPFLNGTHTSLWCMMNQVMDCDYAAFRSIESLMRHPTGMSFSPDNSTIYLIDAVSRSLTTAAYDVSRGVVTSLFNSTSVSDLIENQDAVPKGLATDSSGHLWVGVSGLQQGQIVELDPQTNSIISTIEMEDNSIVDIKFGGADLDFLYILTAKSLYKLKGLGVTGLRVPDFELIQVFE